MQSDFAYNLGPTNFTLEIFIIGSGPRLWRSEGQKNAAVTKLDVKDENILDYLSSGK